MTPRSTDPNTETIAMRTALKPRPGVYDLYWQFAFKRHKAFEDRVAGKPAPWSDDPIIRTFKFCNVYRAADRVSQYLIRDVAYRADDSKPEDRIFQILAFRTFSKIGTWIRLEAILGRSPRIDDLTDGSFEAALTRIKAEQGGLYTGAFILCATDAFGRQQKHLNHVELFRHMFVTHELGQRALESKRLEDLYRLLHSFPLMGDFMSYQTAIDLNYSNMFDFSESEFTQPGPGAVRGLKKVFLDLGSYTPSEAIMWMVDNQHHEFERLGLPFGGLWGRPIQAIDAQNLFCETDKYCREAVPELTSARSRIKARYTQNTRPMRLMFPPKWGINDRLPRGDVFSSEQPSRELQTSLF
jgi:hypothetical protein